MVVLVCFVLLWSLKLPVGLLSRNELGIQFYPNSAAATATVCGLAHLLPLLCDKLLMWTPQQTQACDPRRVSCRGRAVAAAAAEADWAAIVTGVGHKSGLCLGFTLPLCTGYQKKWCVGWVWLLGSAAVITVDRSVSTSSGWIMGMDWPD